MIIVLIKLAKQEKQFKGKVKKGSKGNKTVYNCIENILEGKEAYLASEEVFVIVRDC